MKYRTTVTLRLSDSKYEELKEIAERLETSISSIIRQAVNLYLSK